MSTVWKRPLNLIINSLTFSLGQFPPIFMNELFSVMMFLNFSTELLSLMQSIISYAEMAEN